MLPSLADALQLYLPCLSGPPIISLAQLGNHLTPKHSRRVRSPAAEYGEDRAWWWRTEEVQATRTARSHELERVSLVSSALMRCVNGVKAIRSIANCHSHQEQASHGTPMFRAKLQWRPAGEKSHGADKEDIRVASECSDGEGAEDSPRQFRTRTSMGGNSSGSYQTAHGRLTDAAVMRIFVPIGTDGPRC